MGSLGAALAEASGAGTLTILSGDFAGFAAGFAIGFAAGFSVGFLSVTLFGFFFDGAADDGTDVVPVVTEALTITLGFGLFKAPAAAAGKAPAGCKNPVEMSTIATNGAVLESENNEMSERQNAIMNYPHVNLATTCKFPFRG